MNSKYKFIPLILVSIGLILTALDINYWLNLNTERSDGNMINENIFKLNLKALKVSKISESIHIDNNWSDARDIGICTGNGTYLNPYIIKNLVIDSIGVRECILIENSNVYFKIVNCTLFCSDIYYFNKGISLSYVTNSELINNTCYSNNFAISLYNSNYNMVFNNNINNNDNGITLSNCDHNNISGNIIYNNSVGITLASGSYGPSEVGYSEENHIYENIVLNNEMGVEFYCSNNNLITYNRIENNHVDGLNLRTSFSNLISKNSIKNNLRNGIFLTLCLYNNLYENNININYCGINLSQSNLNEIIGNDMRYNDICWMEYDCEGNIFKNNNCGGDIAIKGYNLLLLFSVFSIIFLILIIHNRKQ